MRKIPSQHREYQIPQPRSTHLPCGGTEYIHTRLPALGEYGTQSPAERSANQAQRGPEFPAAERRAGSQFRIKKNDESQNPQTESGLTASVNLVVAKQQRVKHQKPQWRDGDDQRRQARRNRQLGVSQREIPAHQQ